MHKTSSALPLFILIFLLCCRSRAAPAQAGDLLTVPNLSDNALRIPPIVHSKRSTVHTAIAQGAPGYPDWRIRYIKVASFIPIQTAAERLISRYTSLLRTIAEMDLDRQLIETIGFPFELDIQGFYLNFHAPLGRLTKAFVIEVIEELLASTKLGWVTQFRSEWKDMVSGFTVYITLAWGSSQGPTGIAAGPIDRL